MLRVLHWAWKGNHLLSAHINLLDISVISWKKNKEIIYKVLLFHYFNCHREGLKKNPKRENTKLFFFFSQVVYNLDEKTWQIEDAVHLMWGLRSEFCIRRKSQKIESTPYCCPFSWSEWFAFSAPVVKEILTITLQNPTQQGEMKGLQELSSRNTTSHMCLSHLKFTQTQLTQWSGRQSRMVFYYFCVSVNGTE